MQELVKPLRGYSDEPKFYVYFHKRPDGTIFYVGKGHGKRAWVKKSRNNHWNNVVNKYGGFEVEIVVDNLTEQEAFFKEREFVLSIGIDNLTNQTLGGISTTGYRHTEETLQLQRELAQKRIEDNPELIVILRDRLKDLHYKQKYDIEYKQRMSEIQKSSYARLSDEEKEEKRVKKTAWLKNPESIEILRQKATERASCPKFRKHLSDLSKERWASYSDEYRALLAKKSSDYLNRPEIRAKMIESASDKIVVNMKYLFKSKKQFLDIIGSFHAPLSKAFSTAITRFGFDFCVFSGFFIEDYDSTKHVEIQEWCGEQINKLNFDCLPRSKAVVMDNQTIFLSMKEASIFCNGATIEATADFITKNIKLGKPAMGHYWRVATNEEIRNEIIKRVKIVAEGCL